MIIPGNVNRKHEKKTPGQTHLLLNPCNYSLYDLSPLKKKYRDGQIVKSLEIFQWGAFKF